MELSTYDYEDHTSSTVHLPLRRLRREVRDNDEYNLNSNGEPEVRRLDQAPVCKGTFGINLRGTYTPRGSKMSGQDPRHMSYNNSHSVCIKVLRYEVKKRDEQHFLELVQQLRRKIELWCSLEHSNVTSFYGWIIKLGHDQTLYMELISEWCNGRDVKEYLHNNPNVNRNELVAQIASGLDYLHGRDIIHGDLRPKNVLIGGRDNQAKLVDYGLLTILLEASIHSDTPTVTCGLRYAAPELLIGKTLDGRNRKSDVWAFGCVAAEIIQDQIPYHWISRDASVPQASTRKKLPYELRGSNRFKNAINSCVAYNAKERPTIREIVRSLRTYFFWLKNRQRIKAYAEKAPWDSQERWDFAPAQREPRRNPVDHREMRHVEYQRGVEQQRGTEPRRQATPMAPPLVRELVDHDE